jgi:hypothetical protein
MSDLVLDDLRPMEREILRQIMAFGLVALDATGEPDPSVRAKQLAVIVRSEPFATPPERFTQAMVSSSVPKVSENAATGTRNTVLPGHFTELWLTGVRVEGRLDLSHGGRLGSPLPHMRFTECVFTDSIDLSSSLMGGMRVEKCRLEGEYVLADGTRFADKFTLRDCRVRAAIELILNKCRVDNTCEIARLKPDLHPDAQGALFVGTEGTGDGAAATQDPVAHKEEKLGQLQMNDAVVAGDLLLEGLQIKDQTKGKTLGNKTAYALDLRGVNVLGSIKMRSDGRVAMEVTGGTDLYCARVGGDVEIQGVVFSRDGMSPSLRLDAANVSGTVEITKLEEIQTKVSGNLSLMGLHTGQQLLLKHLVVGQEPPPGGSGNTGLNLKKTVELYKRATDKRNKEKDEEAETRFDAVSMDGAVIGSDFHVRECDVLGVVRLLGCSVGGQLGLIGSTLLAVPTWKRVVEARDMDAKGGIFLIPAGKRPLKTVGEMDFRRVECGSDFKVTGVDLNGGRSNFALRVDAAQILGDLTIGIASLDYQTPGSLRECRIRGTVRLAGAHVHGRLLLVAAEIWGKAVDKTAGVLAVVGSGARVGGGAFFLGGESVGRNGLVCRLRGCLRLNHAVIADQFVMNSVTIAESQIGISAVGLMLAGSITLNCCNITGEVRMWGARIDGELAVNGGSLRMGSSADVAFCLDAYNAEITKGVRLGRYECGVKGMWKRLEMVGIVGFAFSQLGNLEVGRYVKENVRSPAVKLKGTLRLVGMRVKQLASLRRVMIEPPCLIEDRTARESIINALAKWRLTDTRTLVDAEHADFGMTLDIALDGLCGMVRLYGAHVDELYDGGGRGWGELPLGQGWKTGPPTRENLRGVGLCLNGFTYSHLEELSVGERKEEVWRYFAAKYAARETSRFWQWTDGWTGRRARLTARTLWLRRQKQEMHEKSRFFPQPHVQLAKVLRAEGLWEESGRVTRERRDLQRRRGGMGRAERWLWGPFGFFFGFGYSAKRAGASLVILLLASTCFTLVEQVPAMLASTEKGEITLNPDWKEWTWWGLLRERTNEEQTPKFEGKVCHDPIFYGVRLVLPLAHLESGAGCELAESANEWVRVTSGAIKLSAWLIVPFAALTFSGVLREKDDSGAGGEGGGEE